MARPQVGGAVAGGTNEVAIALALAAAAVAMAAYAAHRMRLPAVFGALLVGVAFRPIVEGRAILSEGALDLAAEGGVLLLLFLIGTELDLDRLRKTIRETAWVLPFDLLLPIAIGGGIARLAGWTFGESLALGVAVALSSTLLGERLSAGISTGARRRVLGVLVSQDAAAGVLLALLALAGAGIESAGFAVLGQLGRMAFWLAVLTAGALVVVPRLMDGVARQHAHELVVLCSLAVVAVFAALGGLAGSMELGVFLAGVAAAEAGSQYVIRNALQGIRDAAVAVFFVATGLGTDIAPVVGVWWMPLLLAIGFFSAKFFAHAPTALATGATSVQALRTGFSLAALGEFSLILITVGTASGIMHPLAGPVVIAALLLTAPMAAIGVATAPRLAQLIGRLPERWLRPMVRLQRGLVQRDTSAPAVGVRRTAFRAFIANIILLIVIAGTAATIVPWSLRNLPLPDAARLPATVAVWALVFALSIPVLRATWARYRRFAWAVMAGEERTPAARLRVLLMDVLVGAIVVVILGVVSVPLPAAMPVLIASIVLAIAGAALAWRRLNRLHSDLERSVRRVLGDTHQAAPMLNELLARYPWGVRSVAVGVPLGSPIANETIHSSRIGSLSGAMVAVLIRGGSEMVNPPTDTKIRAGDTLVLMGDAHQIGHAEALLVSHGDAIRMAARSQAARLDELVIHPDSPWAGRPIGDIDVKRQTGALVAGVWPEGRDSPIAYRAQRILQPGDRLMLLGTELQIRRAVERAAPVDADPDDEPGTPEAD